MNWITDSDGKKSLTATAFVIGFCICNVKLLLSGVTVAGISFGVFSGGDFGMALGALGAIYVMRRNVKTSGSTDASS
jgi:hypothetical protein